MTRDRKRNKKPMSSSGDRTEGMHLYEIPSPYAGMDESEVIASLVAMGEGFNAQYNEALEDLEKRILGTNPLQMLAMFSFYMLTTGLGAKPITSKNVGQPDGEFLQALVLKHALEHFVPDPVLPDAFQPILDNMHAMSQAFALRRQSQLSVNMPIEERAAIAARESIRLHTQGIRNWGYPKQIHRLITELFAPLDDEIERKLGVRVQHLTMMGLKAIKLIEDRVNNHFTKLRPMLRAKTVLKVARAYYKWFGSLSGCPEDTVQISKERGWTADMLKQIFISHIDLSLPDLFIFSLDDFVNLYPAEVDGNALRLVLERWSFRFGDLAVYDTERFFMGNPVWRRPIIRLGSDLFFWPIVTLFLSFGVEIMEELTAELGLESRYEKRRASLLEQETGRLFQEAFPSARIYQGSQWQDPIVGKIYENDLLVALNSHLIVVEAKSAKVTESALRGGEKRLKRVVNELMVSPSNQSQRFADYLQANHGILQFSTKSGGINEVDTSRVTRVVRLSVTLERIGDLIAQSRMLQKAGIIPSDTNPAPTIALPDLEVVFTILDSDCKKLHYLTRRPEIERRTSYLGDESDLLAFYLHTGFNIAETEFDNTRRFMLYGMGEVFDSFFLQAEHGMDVSTPRLRITKWWQDILSRVECLELPQWSELGCLLLNVSYEDQQMFATQVQRVKEKMLSGSNTLDTVILVCGPPQRRDLFLGCCYHRMSREDRNTHIEQMAGRVMEEQGLDRAVIIGLQVEDTGYPYDVLVLSIPAKEESSSPGS